MEIGLKKNWSKSAVIILVIGVVSVSAAAGYFRFHESYERKRLAKRLGAGINIGNTLDSTGLWEYKPEADELEYETYWNNPRIDAALFAAIKQGGFETVRLPVTWEDHLDENYQISVVWMDRVQEVTDMALAQGLYVILDLHHEEWLDLRVEYEEEISANLAAVWKQIAERFYDYDERLLFEAMNEPRLRGSEEEWTHGTAKQREMVNRLNYEFIMTVRAVGGGNADRYLLISPYAAATDEQAMRSLQVPEEEKRLLVSLHMYEPYRFCQDRADTEWDTPEARGKIDGIFSGINEIFLQKDIPVVLTEFGCQDKGNLEQRLSWTGYYLEKLHEYHIPYIWWDCENYSLIDRESKAWKFPEIVEMLTGREN